ncbi:class I SAM-dependent methyltransferase [Dactylosporangium salmoneum]|uniref:Class I SAM-dependent methyltransferase n=1 Tax=Dactylosporangium salmoneum TaxID=53361 RepID=A0ABN3HFY3_9ACTN
MPTADETHHHRTVAESFGVNAQRYDRARPTYPDALIERLAERRRDVLDVGCGTGIAARLLQQRGCDVLGVDPDPRMAEEARRRGLDVEVATIEAWEPAGRTFDAVVAAQAWHWIDPEAGASKAAAVLRPAGLLATFWNAFVPPDDVAEGMTAVFRRVLPDMPQAHRWQVGPDSYAILAARAADGARATGRFGEPQEWRFPWERSYTPAEWLDVLPTFGTLNRLDPRTLGEALDGVAAVVREDFVMRYTTVVMAAERTA